VAFDHAVGALAAYARPLGVVLIVAAEARVFMLVVLMSFEV
jgi:hypothetical protein